MDTPVVPLLARRRIEAEILHRVHRSLRDRIGEEAALAALGEAVEAAARDAGREFALAASGGPSFEHFTSVLSRWREGGALSLEEVSATSHELAFTVTRCAYAELYRSLGIPQALAYILSCRRDAAFATGYDPGIEMERSPTIVEGHPFCRFRFHVSAPAPGNA